MGNDKAAAEWLIRNGAKVVWLKKTDLIFNDYEQLMKKSQFNDDYIYGIDATQSSINYIGFPYLSIHFLMP